MANWWESPFRVFQTNLREIDAGLDVERHVEEIKRMGADTWLINTAGIVSFFPSKLPYQHPSPWLKDRTGGDLIGDAVEAAHRAGVRIVSRVDFSKLHQDVYEAHPDWFYVSPKRQPQIYNGLYSACPNGAYYQEKSLEIIDEVLARYDVDGFFFNMFTFPEYDYSRTFWGICQCVNCQRRFKSEAGQDLPQAPDWQNPAYVAHLDFKRKVLAELSGRIRDRIRSKPGTCLLLRQTSDVTMHEVNNAVDRPLPLPRFWPGDVAKQDRGADPAKPVVTNVVLFLDIPYRFSAEQPGLVQVYGAQVLAHGVNPWIYVVGTLDQPDRKNFEAGAGILRFHRENEDLYAGSRLCPVVAIVSSTKSEERYGRERGQELVGDAYRGAYRAFVEEHIPFVVVPDAVLPDKQRNGELAKYRCLVLPNVAALSEAEASAIDAYVQAGGGLVATFESGHFDEAGRRRDRFALQCLADTVAIARRGGMRSAYLRITDRGDIPGFDLSQLVMVDGEFLYVDAGKAATTSMTLIPPSRYGPPEKTYWDVETAHPGLVKLGYG
ncbi:MAG: beta-galactosidase trimerization domain-containing protein, partial [Chloroflexi bacterium]|nr:beta-galactosidase trimerization domain-containing protein [Chloroflexota bacterium]